MARDKDKLSPIGPRVTVQDIRTARYCLAGVRPWFRRHRLCWHDFLAHGIDAATLLATGDALVEPVIRAAEERDRMRARPGQVSATASAPNSSELPDGR
jgi:hypothetical protein